MTRQSKWIIFWVVYIAWCAFFLGRAILLKNQVNMIIQSVCLVYGSVMLFITVRQLDRKLQRLIDGFIRERFKDR